MCVCSWGEYRSAGYTKQHSFPLVGSAYQSNGYKLPILPSDVDTELVLKHFFIFTTLKPRVYGTCTELQGGHWLAALYVVFSKVPYLFVKPICLSSICHYILLKTFHFDLTVATVVVVLARKWVVTPKHRGFLGSAFLDLGLASVRKFRKGSSGEIAAVVTV